MHCSVCLRPLHKFDVRRVLNEKPTKLPVESDRAVIVVFWRDVYVCSRPSSPNEFNVLLTVCHSDVIT
jgi:hypothetical protein